MPFYTFKCPECKFELTELREMGDFKEPICKDCKDNSKKSIRMKKQIGIPSKPQFKGSGFYETDYKPKITGPGIHSTPEAAMRAAKGKK